MSNRTVRINELVQRELNGILRRRYQEESVAITITEVRIAPDLRDGKVRVAIVGNDEVVERGMVWLRRKSAEIREELGKLITLKFLPKLVYALDETTPRSARVLAMRVLRRCWHADSGLPLAALRWMCNRQPSCLRRSSRSPST